jgi:drug/metabolite transporter (DMT)-like permease
MDAAIATPALRKPKLQDMALVFLLGSLWGSSFLAIKLSVFEVGPLLLGYLRVFCALVPLAAYMAWRGVRLPVNRHDWKLLCVMSILNTVVPFFLINWANLHIDSGVAALIMGIGPLLTLFVTHLTTHDDRFTLNKLLGILTGLTGLVIIIGTEALSGFSQSLLGDLAMLGTIFCYVVSTSLVRKLRETPKEAIATVNMGLSAIALTPVVFLFETPSLENLSVTGALAILYLGACVTGIGYLMRYHLVLTVGQNYMAMGSYVMPVVGVGMGAVFLGEPVSVKILLALALVLAGFAVARVRS